MAAIARVAFAVVSFVVEKTFLIPDEQQYVELAATVSGGKTAEDWFPNFGQSLYDTTWAFVAPLRLLFDVFWPSRLVGQLLAATFGVVVVALVTYLALQILPRRWALAAGLVAALLPSQILWSSVVLRESMVWAGLLVAAVAMARSLTTTGWASVAWVGAAGAGLLLTGLLRDQTMLAATWALVPAVVLAGGSQRLRRIAAVLGVVVVVPILSGAGPAGTTLIAERVPALGWMRTTLGMSAESAFTGTTLPPAPTTTAPVEVVVGPLGPEDQRLGLIPIGPDGPRINDRTGGEPDVIASPGFGGSDDPYEPSPPATIVTTTTLAPPTTTTTLPNLEPGQTVIVSPAGQTYVVEETAGANLRSLPTGAIAVLFRPFPWNLGGSLPLRFAAVENLGWYALYLLAAYAVLAMTRERRRLVLYPVFAAVAILGVAFLTQGNLGTAFRHRGQVLPLLVVPAAYGASIIAARIGARRRARVAVPGVR